jgi:LysR family hydrogen peroxide-inducible transcriptional activator
MELHQLRYFAAVARTGNFTKAAVACNVSQPSLSQQILKLEAEVGEALFERRRDGAELTLAGGLLLRHAERVLGEVAEAESRLRDIRRVARGRLRIGAIPTIAPYLLPAPLARFRQQFPGVELTLHEMVTDELLAAVHGQELDVAIASDAAHADGLEKATLLREPLWLAVPATHPLATAARATIEDVRNEHFVVLREEHCLSATVSGFCEQNQVAPNIVCHGAQVQTVMQMVAAGLGLSLVPALACEQGVPNGLVLRALDGTAPQRSIIAYWPERKEPANLVASLLTMLREQQTAASLRALAARAVRGGK